MLAICTSLPFTGVVPSWHPEVNKAF